MAFALIVLAVGSVFAGYVGVPAALGGSNRIEHYLAPSFEARAENLSGERVAPGFSPAPSEPAANEPAEHSAAGGDAHGEGLSEAALMGVSILVALAGIGIAWYFFISNPSAADSIASSAAPVHTLLLNKYYVDEAYDAAIVQPVVNISRGGLWKIVDAEVIDGAVNGTGSFVNASATALRRLQTGSVRVYAASLMVGVVLVLAFYVWRFAQGAF
jgi:NADH-quinone oxidoreductase subunit L